MTWTVEYDQEFHVVVLTYTDECSGKDFRDASRKRIAVATEVECSNTLIDATYLECGSSTTYDVFEIVSTEYPRAGSRNDWRIAITIPKSEKAHRQVDFYENACVNRGWKVKKFATREEAIDWLSAN